MRRRASVLLLVAGAALPCATGCKAVIDADGYVVEEAVCGEGFLWPELPEVRGCVNSVSCYPYPPPYTISECLSYDPMEQITNRPASAYDSCDAYRSLNPEAYVEVGGCEPGTDACDGTRRVNCEAKDGFAGWQVDCGMIGARCEDTGEDPSRARCVLDNVTCDGTTSTAACSGNYAYVCEDGTAVGRDCQKQFAVCEGGRCYFQSGSSTCGPDLYGKEWCEGDVAYSCDEFGTKYQYDCAAKGLTCGKGFGGACVAPGCTFQDYMACEESCDGNIATVCFGGVALTFDCTGTYGFGGCKQTRHPDRKRLDGSDLYYVRCVR